MASTSESPLPTKQEEYSMTEKEKAAAGGIEDISSGNKDDVENSENITTGSEGDEVEVNDENARMLVRNDNNGPGASNKVGISSQEGHQETPQQEHVLHSSRRKPQLMYSTVPQYGPVYFTILAIFTIILLIAFPSILAMLLYSRVTWLFWLLSSLIDAFIMLFVLCRIPIRYQIWSDRLVVTTLESYILPFRLFSYSFKVKLLKIKEIQEVRYSVTETCLFPETYFTIFPATFTTSFLVDSCLSINDQFVALSTDQEVSDSQIMDQGQKKFIRLLVDDDLFWRNFILTPKYHRQFVKQLKRAIGDCKALYSNGYDDEDDDDDDDIFDDEENDDDDDNDIAVIQDSQESETKFNVRGTASNSQPSSLR